MVLSTPSSSQDPMGHFRIIVWYALSNNRILNYVDDKILPRILNLILHCPGNEHVVPDAVSIPEASLEGDVLIIFLYPEASFFRTILCYDVPFLVGQVFDDVLQCITLSCSLSDFKATICSQQQVCNLFPTLPLRYTD